MLREVMPIADRGTFGDGLKKKKGLHIHHINGYQNSLPRSIKKLFRESYIKSTKTMENCLIDPEARLSPFDLTQCS